MPKGGFGNLIALPLQAVPRKAGNSVFIDSNFRPDPEQWAFLSTLERVPVVVADELVAEAQRKGDLIGVRASVTDDEDGKIPGHCRRPEKGSNDQSKGHCQRVFRLCAPTSCM